MTTARRIPSEWPRGMRQEVAAAYCGMSLNSFKGMLRARIQQGEWTPTAKTIHGNIVEYDKKQIDELYDMIFADSNNSIDQLLNANSA